MKRLLLATDLCANSDRAMERAVRLAKEHGAELTILHVVSGKKKSPDELEERATEIESYVGEYKESRGLNVSIDILISSKAHEIICDQATKMKADLVVMGMHRKARFMDLFMATTFSRVLQGCPVPVLMVKEKPVAPYESVLCGVDFASGSYKALETAVSFASDAKFEIVHAHENFILNPNAQYVEVEDGYPKNLEECEVEMAKFIDKQKKRYADLKLGAEMNIEYSFVEADPYYALLEKVQEDKVELLCVGTHGHETSKIGPVTNSLMADPPCDILVAK